MGFWHFSTDTKRRRIKEGANGKGKTKILFERPVNGVGDSDQEETGYGNLQLES